MIEITAELVEKTLTEIVDEFGEDYVYQSESGAGGDCRYVHSGGPSDASEYVPGCLVGHFYHRVGAIDLGDIYSGDANDSLDAEGLTDLLVGNNVIDVTDNAAIPMLYRAQYKQDRRETWGDALKGALEARLENE